MEYVWDVEGVGMMLNNEGDDFIALGEVSSSTKWKSISSELTEDDLNIKNIAEDNESSIKMVGRVVINNQGAFWHYWKIRRWSTPTYLYDLYTRRVDGEWP